MSWGVANLRESLYGYAMDSLTSTFRAVSDPTRRTILDLLQQESRSVTDLARHFSMSRPAVSKHLAILREAGLAVSRRKGRQQIYELETAPMAPAREWLELYAAAVHAPDLHAPRPAAADAPRRRTKPARRAVAAAHEDWRCW